MGSTFQVTQHRTVAAWLPATSNEGTHGIVTACDGMARKNGGLKKSQKNLRRGQLT